MRVVLVDDHPTMRSGVRGVLVDAGFDVVAEAGSLAAARRAVVVHCPDLLVLDLGLGAEPTLDVLPELAALTRVLVHSMYAELAGEALARGAHGFVSKDAPAENLVAAAHALIEGRRYVEPTLAAELAVGPVAGPLSTRERQVLDLLAEGHTNREVAGILAVSVRTVESARASLRTRLGLVSRADLVAYRRKSDGGAG